MESQKKFLRYRSFENSHDRRNTDNFFESMLDLNNHYAGLMGHSGYALGMQNGTEYLTNQEAWVAYGNGTLDELKNSSGGGYKLNISQGSYDWQREAANWATEHRSNTNSRVSTYAPYALMNKHKGQDNNQAVQVG